MRSKGIFGKYLLSWEALISMVLHLSKTDKEKLKEGLDAAKPFMKNDHIELDGDIDTARWKATMAQKFLRMVDDDGPTKP